MGVLHEKEGCFMAKMFKKVLVANRGEIAMRIFRACHDLGLQTIAIYSNEDTYSIFRTAADESYLIGENESPLGGLSEYSPYHRAGQEARSRRYPSRLRLPVRERRLCPGLRGGRYQVHWPQLRNSGYDG